MADKLELAIKRAVKIIGAEVEKMEGTHFIIVVAEPERTRISGLGCRRCMCAHIQHAVITPELMMGEGCDNIPATPKELVELYMQAIAAEEKPTLN